MSISIRQARPDDARVCGRICHDAFAAIANAHNFPPDFPNADVATGLLEMLTANPGFWGIVAEENGNIVGSNFLDERSTIAGLGPITVEPGAQNKGVGASLMRAAMERAAAKGFAGLRLVQSGYHCRSLSLYSKLGFDVREPLACLQGKPIREIASGYDVRATTEADLLACNALCVGVHGTDRGGEVRDAIAQGVASVVERNGRITGYATGIAFFGHAIAETTDDLKALIGASESFGGPGFLVPTRNGELMRWCLSKGLRMTQPMTLMTMGLYNEPNGAYLPSILF